LILILLWKLLHYHFAWSHCTLGIKFTCSNPFSIIDNACSLRLSHWFERFWFLGVMEAINCHCIIHLLSTSAVSSMMSPCITIMLLLKYFYWLLILFSNILTSLRSPFPQRSACEISMIYFPYKLNEYFYFVKSLFKIIYL
jgi:hypothetical protein